MNDRNIRRFERATRVQTFGRDHAADLAAQGSAGVLARSPMRRERASKSRHPVFSRPRNATAQALSPSCVLRLAVLRLPTAYELPADFVTDLRADRDALTACNTGKHSANQEGVEATAAIDDLLAQAQSVISRLDGAVKNKYARDPEKLAAWKSASHTVKPEKKPAPPENPNPPAP